MATRALSAMRFVRPPDRVSRFSMNKGTAPLRSLVSINETVILNDKIEENGPPLLQSRIKVLAAESLLTARASCEGFILPLPNSPMTRIWPLSGISRSPHHTIFPGRPDGHIGLADSLMIIVIKNIERTFIVVTTRKSLCLIRGQYRAIQDMLDELEDCFSSLSAFHSGCALDNVISQRSWPRCGIDAPFVIHSVARIYGVQI